MTAGALGLYLLAGSATVIAAIVAARLAHSLGLPALLVFLGLGLALGENAIGIRFDNAGLAEALGLVVFLQTRAEAAGLDAYNRVGAGIVAGGFVEDFQRQSILFEILRTACQRLFHAEAQEPLETARLREARTGQNLFEVNANGVAGNRRCRAGHRIPF